MNNKRTKYIVISLVVLNAVCLFFLMRPHREPHHPPKITDIINFNDATKLKIDEMEKSHFNQIDKYTKKIKAIRKGIYFHGEQSDKTDYDSAFRNIAENQKKIEELRFTYFKEIKNLCPENQRKEIDMFVKRMLEHESLRRPKGK